MFEDNQSTTVMAKNQQFHGRVKHIDIRHHLFKNKWQMEPSNWNIAQQQT